MNLLEIGILIIAGLGLIVSVLPNINNNIKRFLPLLGGVLIPIQLFVYGYRWQMVPIYVFMAFLIVICFVKYSRKRKGEPIFKNRVLRKITVILTIIAFIGAVIFPIFLPIINLPEPMGSYQIGTTSLKMVDYNMEELFTEDNSDIREFVVNIWYPAEIDEDDELATYWDKGGAIGRAYSLDAGMGAFWYSHLNKVETNSYIDAKMSDDKKEYPVIIYSPSYWGMNTENTMLFETLASHGYIVVSISHSYEMITSLFPDGSTVDSDMDYIESIVKYDEEAEIQLYKDYYNTDDTEARKELIEKMLVADELMHILIDIRVQDSLFVIDKLSEMNDADGLFKSKVDTDNVGILGWSFGGATAMEACITSDVFKAGINIDGWPYGRVTNTEAIIEKPFMVISGEEEDQMDEIINDFMFNKLSNNAYLLEIENTGHMNFWDFPLFFKVYSYLGYWNRFDAMKMKSIEETYIVGFFDKYLKNEIIDLTDVQIYDEVIVEYK